MYELQLIPSLICIRPVCVSGVPLSARGLNLPPPPTSVASRHPQVMAAGDAKRGITVLRCGAASLFLAVALLACWAVFPSLHLLAPSSLPFFSPFYTDLATSLTSRSPPYGSAFTDMFQSDQRNDERVARTSGLHSYSQPLVRGKPEFECTHTYYFPCTHEDKRKGPPLHMLAPGGLSSEDRAMLLALRRFRRQREEGARRVPEEKRKVAFLFLTKGPLPMAPLWERFFKVGGWEGRRGGEGRKG